MRADSAQNRVRTRREIYVDEAAAKRSSQLFTGARSSGARSIDTSERELCRTAEHAERT
jgi:hypothetical protein